MSDLNDPRVLFAAERTLLAWTRTSLTLMGLGFAVERFGLFLHMLRPEAAQEAGPFAVGVSLLVLGASTSLLSVVQYRRVVATLSPAEIPSGYWITLGSWLNVALGILGAMLIVMLSLERL